VAIIWKVHEVDPMTCPKCGDAMKVIAFITEYSVVDRIIDHLKLKFVAEKGEPIKWLSAIKPDKMAPRGKSKIRF